MLVVEAERGPDAAEEKTPPGPGAVDSPARGFCAAPQPPDEAARLGALRAYYVLDTGPEEPFDDAARLAAQVCETPVALVSLVDAERQWFKARIGVEASQTPRSVAFCAHAILGRDLLEVPDAAADPRFSGNPLVTGAPHVRFYAGAPLLTADGHALGTLCVIDHRPRQLSPGQRQALAVLAKQVVAHLELRRRVRELSALAEERERDRAEGEKVRAERDRAEAVVRETVAFASAPRLPLPPTVPRRPGLLLLVSVALPLALTAWGFRAAQERVRTARLTRFDRAVATVEASVRGRLASYRQILTGCRATLLSRGSLGREEWSRLAAGLALADHPGVVAVGYVARVGRADLPSFEAAAEQPGYLVRPRGDRPEYLPILHLEPREADAGAPGFDVGTDPVRREAAERSRDASLPAVSGRLQLPGEATGFWMLLPVYAPDQPAASPEERRTALRGWIFAAVRAADLLTGLPSPMARELDVEVFDSPGVSYERLLLDGDSLLRAVDPGPRALSRGVPLDLWGRPWSLHLTTLPAFERPAREPGLALLLGLVVSALAGGVAWSLASTRGRALALAESMTAAVREGEARTRAVVDGVVDGIITFDEGGAIRSFNRAAEGIFLHPPSAVLGRSIESLIPETRGDLRDGFRNESRGRRSDGSEFPVDLAVSELHDQGRTLFVAVVRDVTERKRAEEALRGSEARTRSMVENLLGGLLTFGEDFRIDSANRTAERLFGAAPGSLLGRPVGEILAGAREGEALREALLGVLGKVSEWEGRRADGTVFPFELSLFEFQAEGSRHLAAHVRDLSERREVERLKKEFLSTVSHELRTPLTSIRGSLSLLSSGAVGELPAEAAEVAAIAERNSLRLIGLINDILDLERLETGRLEMHPEEVGLREVAERSIESVRPMADQAGIALVPPASDARVLADPDRLVQVLVNLLSNAVKFSPAGSAVTVTVSEDGGWAEARVADRGRGIPAAFLV